MEARTINVPVRIPKSYRIDLLERRRQYEAVSQLPSAIEDGQL